MSPSSLYDLALGSLLAFSSGCSRDLFAQPDDPHPGARPPVASSAALGTAPLIAASNSVAPNPSVVPQPLETNARYVCNEQPPQEFLVRGHVNNAAKNQAERLEQRRLRTESIAYRTKQYGYFKGFGNAADQPTSAKAMCELTRFFGIPVMLNRRVIPALKCVEDHLVRDCAKENYRPTILSGLRHKNTYFDGEVSTHVYGIAIDVDPLQNPCCNCLEPWRSSPRCKGEKTVWERMSMPRCWVEVFERYGFYWLGHDVLEDTMHFEFLGDPERVNREPP